MRLPSLVNLNAVSSLLPSTAGWSNIGCLTYAKFPDNQNTETSAGLQWPECYRKSNASYLHGVPYFIVRLVLFLFWFAVFVWSLVYDAAMDTFGDYFSKFTNWTLVLQLVYLGLGTVITGLAVFGKQKLKPVVAEAWALMLPTVTISTFVVSFYLFVMMAEGDFRVIWFFKHGVNFAAVTLVDLVLSKETTQWKITAEETATILFLLGTGGVAQRKKRRALFLNPLCYVTSYLLFNLCYTLFVYVIPGGTNGDGDPYVYEQLDWRKQSIFLAFGYAVALCSLVIFLSFVFPLLIQKILCG